MWFSWLGSSN